MRDNTDIQKVTEFNKACDICRDISQSRKSAQLLRLRIQLITQEFSEYVGQLHQGIAEIRNYGEISKQTLTRIMAENADMRYILAGDSDTLGLPTNAAFNRIHAANMKKVGKDGRVIKREDGKILKPDDWEPANFDDLI